ncbi:MAG: NUDIX domain-containing protein [Candidatus Sungbacteria bacterium]|nr:NUDIX domain-containing protein [Candidatus Sungbacteria bacterium]
METSYIDKLAWVHIKDGKILMTRSRGKDVWYIGGGKREQGESDQAALMREVEEEFTVRLIPESIRHLGTFEAQAHGKPAGTIVRMTCYTGEYAGVLAPAAEVEELAWFGYGDRERTAPVDKIIFDWLKEKNILV